MALRQLLTHCLNGCAPIILGLAFASEAQTNQSIYTDSLVNGWQDNGWGHYFTVDAPIGTAMGSDYDALVLIGGERSVAKLKTNPHARRIVNHFLEANKPVAAIGAGVALLALSPKSAGRDVAALPELQAELTTAQMVLSAEAQTVDGSLLTSTGADVPTWVAAVLSHFSAGVLPEEEAAVAA